MRSTPRQSLDYFFRVAQSGSIRGAADQLRIAPSAVSRKIAQLEYEYGIELFIRQTRGVQLTQAGETLFKHLSGVRSLDISLNQTISDIRGLREGLVRIALGSGFLREFVSTSLAEFFTAYPRIRIDVVTAQADDIIDAVMSDVAEIGVVFGAVDDPSLNILFEAERPIHLVISSKHTFAGQREVTLAEINEVPIALPPPGSGIRQVIDRAYQSVGHIIEPSLTVGPAEALIQFAETGAGGTFLPAFSCRRELSAGKLAAVKISGPMLRTKAVVLTRQDRHLSPAAIALLDVFENTLMLSEDA